jgi:hypothetical protein
MDALCHEGEDATRKEVIREIEEAYLENQPMIFPWSRTANGDVSASLRADSRSKADQNFGKVHAMSAAIKDVAKTVALEVTSAYQGRPFNSSSWRI